MEDVESEARRYVAALYMADPLVEIVSVSPEALKFVADKGWLTTDTDGGHESPIRAFTKFSMPKGPGTERCNDGP